LKVEREEGKRTRNAETQRTHSESEREIARRRCRKGAPSGFSLS
jgi:hypothetical protein